jgi:hypothetical protein
MKKRSVVLPLCIAIAAVAVAILSAPDPAQEGSSGSTKPASVPCPAEMRALLDGLDVGQDLGVYSVTAVRCSQPDVIDIEVLRDEATRLVLTVAKPGAVPHLAPRKTAKHDLFYSRRGARDGPPTSEEISELLGLLALRVEAAEQRTGAPQGP